MVGGGEELDASAVCGPDGWAGDGDGGEAGETGGGGVAEDGFAGFGVVFSGAELVDGGARGDEEVVGLEEGGHLAAEVCEAFVVSDEFGGGDGGSGGEALGEDGFEVLVVAAMDGGCFGGYDGRVDGRGFLEEVGVDGG